MEEDDDEEEDEAESDDEDQDDEDSAEEEEDDANLKVDPEFRKRVAEALQVSGMGVDDDAEEGDDEEESDEEVWDDDKMMLVDEQLAEVFRQRANAGKSSDFKRRLIYASIVTVPILTTRSSYPVCSLQDSYSRLFRCSRSKTTRQPNNPPHHGALASTRFLCVNHGKRLVKQSRWYPQITIESAERSAHVCR
jgi:hypothetical protein